MSFSNTKELITEVSLWVSDEAICTETGVNKSTLWRWRKKGTECDYNVGKILENMIPGHAENDS